MKEVDKIIAELEWFRSVLIKGGKIPEYYEAQVDILTKAIKILEQSESQKGEWIYGEDEYGIDGYHCDQCGFFIPWDYTHKFIDFIKDYHWCPSCRTPMRTKKTDYDYERAVDQLEHDMLYEPTFNQDDGSM